MTKLEATLAGDGRSFEDIGAARAKEIERPEPHPWKPAGTKSPPESAEDRGTNPFDVGNAQSDQPGPDREGQ